MNLLVAVAAPAALVLAAPYVGVVWSQSRTALPGQFGLIINGIVGQLVFAAVAASALWLAGNAADRRRG